MDAAGATAWAAAGATAGATAWDAAACAARAAAWDAVEATLKPTRDALIKSAANLVDRMLSVGADVRRAQ